MQTHKCRLNSPATNISAEGDIIFVTTAADSMVVLAVKADVLESIGHDSGQHVGQSHVTLPLHPQMEDSEDTVMLNDNAVEMDPVNLAIMTTKYATVRGFLTPSPSKLTHGKTMPIFFHAKLQQSLTRIRRANIRPLWKPQPPAGMQDAEIVGTATDGTVVGLALLDAELWAKLRWAQILCQRAEICRLVADRERMPEFATYGAPEIYNKRHWLDGVDRSLPFQHNGQLYIDASAVPAEAEHMYTEVVEMPERDKHARNQFQNWQDYVNGVDPMGFAEYEGELRTNASAVPPEKMHIDGDILQRLIDRGGERLLGILLREEARRSDKVGLFVARHLQTELDAVPGVIDVIERALDQWW